MWKTAKVNVIASALVLLAPLAASAEGWGGKGRGNNGWSPESTYSRMYDNKSEQTLSGEVVSIDRIAPLKGMAQGYQLMVNTENQTLPVHLGPAWFLENQEFEIQKGDRLTVKGSRVTFNGKAAIIARQVQKGNLVLMLRDDSGRPPWSARRMEPGASGEQKAEPPAR